VTVVRAKAPLVHYEFLKGNGSVIPWDQKKMQELFARLFLYLGTRLRNGSEGKEAVAGQSTLQ
jgi:hypothetical protein